MFNSIDDAKSELFCTVARLCAAAAVTAPKSGGQLFLKGKPLFLETVFIDAHETLLGLGRWMRQRGCERRQAIWLRDAALAEHLDGVLSIGLKDWYPPIYDCGVCGFATRAEFVETTRQRRADSDLFEFAGPQCNLRNIDLGIAVGSAAKATSLYSVDTRCQTRIAVATRKLGVIQSEVIVALSMTGDAQEPRLRRADAGRRFRLGRPNAGSVDRNNAGQEARSSLATSTGPRARGIAMIPLIAVTMVSFLARLSYQMARSPVLPRSAEHLSAAPDLIGVVIAASTVTGVLFKLPAGALSDLLGRRRVMLLGAVFFAVPPFIYPFVEDAGAALALRFVHGFATAIFSPVVSSYVAGPSEVGRGARLAWFSSANDVGATAGPLVGGLILYATASYLLLGLIGLLALGATLLVPEAEKRTAPVVLTTAAVEAAMCLGFGAFSGFLPLYARTAGLYDAAIAVVLALQLTIAVLAKLLAGILSDGLGRKPVIVLGLRACATALPLIFQMASFGGLVAGVPLLGLGVAAVTPASNALIADLVAAQRLGIGMGVFGTIWDIGEAAGPILAGILIGQIGYEPAFDVIAAIIVTVAVAFAMRVRIATASIGDPKRL